MVLFFAKIDLFYRAFACYPVFDSKDFQSLPSKTGVFPPTNILL